MSAYHCLAPTQNAVILNLKLQPISKDDQNALEIRNGIAPARMPVFYRAGKYYLMEDRKYFRSTEAQVCVGALASDTRISQEHDVPAAIIVSGVAEITSKTLAFLSSINNPLFANLNVLGRSATSASLQFDLRRLTNRNPSFIRKALTGAANSCLKITNGQRNMEIMAVGIGTDLQANQSIYIDMSNSGEFDNMKHQLHATEHERLTVNANSVTIARPDGQTSARDLEGGKDAVVYWHKDGAAPPPANRAQKVSTAGGFGGAAAPLAPAASPTKPIIKKKKRKGTVRAP